MGYRGKIRERERARELRARGWAMPDIAEELGVAKSSVSLWTRDVPLPAGASRATGRRQPRERAPNALQRAKQREIAELAEVGRRRIGALADRDLLIAGTALYAGEGDKTDGAVGFANTNAEFMQLFCRWLRTFFEIDEQRLRARLYLHTGLDLDAATTYWTEVLQIPRSQFRKPYRADPDPTRRHSKHTNGCATVSYSSVRVHREVMGLVNALVNAPSTINQRHAPLLENRDTGSHGR